MSIYIYNSLTRRKEKFIPLNPPWVNIYTCGVTVYDECHIGHARSLYIFDVLRRYLSYRGYKVRFVRNITDIDDKIINRANELGVSWKEIRKKFINRYRQDLKLLGIKKADFEPCATENIKAMIQDIKGLIKKGFAYTSAGDVYFNVRKFPGYGKLSGQSLEEMLIGVRIEPREQKRDPLDFALWKKSKPQEPGWMSPWGRGRPGWHIECSTMSMKYLKTKTLDIHAGGRDLIFPHHENEIAQAEALTGKPFARYWLHHGLLTIEGQKMAKSLGNFVSIKEILKSYSADTLKIFFLSAHYASPIDFSQKKMQEAKEALERIIILMEKIKKVQSPKLKVKNKKIKEIQEIKDSFIKAMDDDFNFPEGLACIFNLVNLANKNIQDLDFIYQIRIMLKELLNIFGISLEIPQKLTELSEEEIRIKISQRDKARKDKNYILSDKIRAELEQKGIILEDTKEGTIWRRKL